MPLLYKLKPPLSHISVSRNKAYNRLAVHIDGHFAGSLDIPIDNTSELLLGVFADTRHEIGDISDGEVYWLLDTTAHGITSVVDSFGNLHLVEDL